MYESDRREPDTDPLAEIIRAAGHRPAPPEEHYKQIFAAAHTVWRRKVAGRRRRRWLAVAASIAGVAVTAGVIQGLLPSEPSQAARLALLQGAVEYVPHDSTTWRRVADPGMVLTAGTRVRTGIGGRAALMLAGGGSLRIDQGTRIVLADPFVELVSGTLYFDSDGRPATAPVEIRTAFGVVRDTGTQFEVRAGPGSMRVRVRTGQIAIVGSPVTDDVVARAGNEIEVMPDREPVERPFAPDDPAWSWAESLAVAPSAQTQSILAWLNWIAHESGKRLEFESRNAELRAQIEDFVGDPKGLTPMQLLGLITATSDFSYELTDDGAILIQRSAGQ